MYPYVHVYLCIQYTDIEKIYVYIHGYSSFYVLICLSIYIYSIRMYDCAKLIGQVNARVEGKLIDFTCTLAGIPENMIYICK